MRVISAICLGIVVLMVIFGLFPSLILEGADTVNSTTNMTKYLGLKEINSLAPLLIFVGLLLAVASAVVWWAYGKRIKGIFDRIDW